MKFCTNCGRENTSNAKFCDNCGNSIVDNAENIGVKKDNKKNNSPVKYIVIVIVVALMVFGGYYLKTHSDNKATKDKFMSTYNEYIDLANKGNFKDSIDKLKSIKKDDVYDEVDIDTDIKIIESLDNIKNSILNDNSNINDLVSTFKSDFEGKYESLKNIVDELLKDAGEYDKYKSSVKKFDDYIKDNDFDKAKEELSNIGGYKFINKDISERVKSRIEVFKKNLDTALKDYEDVQKSKKAENEKKSRRVITKPDGLGGIFTPEYEGQPMVSLREDYSNWISAVTRYLGASSAGELEISYFDDTAAAVYYKDKAIGIVKLNPYAKSLLVYGDYEDSIRY